MFYKMIMPLAFISFNLVAMEYSPCSDRLLNSTFTLIVVGKDYQDPSVLDEKIKDVETLRRELFAEVTHNCPYRGMSAWDYIIENQLEDFVSYLSRHGVIAAFVPEDEGIANAHSPKDSIVSSEGSNEEIAQALSPECVQEEKPFRVPADKKRSNKNKRVNEEKESNVVRQNKYLRFTVETPNRPSNFIPYCRSFGSITSKDYGTHVFNSPFNKQDN